MLNLARAVAAAGGRALVVGGWVRDRLLGRDAKDYDVEVQKLDLEKLEAGRRSLGPVVGVGKSFGVLKVAGTDADVSLPRRESKTGPGHRGFDVALDPGLPFDKAVLRRDLTVNTLGMDPLSGELFDPLRGRRDLEAGVLRAANPAAFGEDPLRGLRVARFAAQLNMSADVELIDLCRGLDLSELPGERMFEEFSRLLLKAPQPAVGFNVLRETAMLRFFPELAALDGVPQDKEWHPEGDVWVHTLMVLDQAAALRSGNPDTDLPLMFGALCHDFGKPATTVTDEFGRVRSPEHEGAGEAPVRTFLERLKAPALLTNQVVALTRHH